MLDFDPQLLTVWGIVAVSLALQLYLFVTWPVSSRARPSAAGSAKDVSAAGRSLETGLSVNPRHRQRSWQQDGWVSAFPPPGGAPLPRANVGTSTSSKLPQTSGHGGRESDLRSAARQPKSPVTLNQRIICAGFYNKRGIRVFHAVRAAACLALLCGGFLIAPLSGLSWYHGLVIGALAGLAGFLVPSFWLDHRLRVRQTKIRRALPDALDLITVCMQGGLSLPAALARVSQELGTAHPMLAMELAIVEREIQMGRTTGDAIRQFANRFSLEELRTLSSVVSQADKYGGSITGALRTYAESLRIKRRQRAEEMAQKAAVKLLFPTLLCIFPGIFVVVLGPTAIRMYQVMVVEHPWGG